MEDLRSLEREQADGYKFSRSKSICKDFAWNQLRRLSRGSRFGRIRVRGHLNYREIVLRFERQSTFHGISHAALATNTKWRIIWYTTFIICFSALIIQIILLIRRYKTYPKSVDLDLKFENAPFPSITLCNINPYRASMIAKQKPTQAMLDAFSIAQNHFDASAETKHVRRETAKSRHVRAIPSTVASRRYHQASVHCLCEINSITGERKKGSCFAAYKGNISIQFTDILARFYPSKCICQLDWVSKTLWPCFPQKTWTERRCKVCLQNSGHCPMKFFDDDDDDDDEKQKTNSKWKKCRCHREYNHCIANNEYGFILELEPTTDISALKISEFFVTPTKMRTATTTPTISTVQTELKEALGFEGLTDEIAIKEQAKENLMFAVGELSYEAKVNMSQRKDELILKCSFNQKDCDIENDFKLHYDQTYGNCYTFNWNRTKQVTAHQAGSNFGLRVLLYANTSEYLPTSESVGFRITIHDKWVMPFPDAFGYNAPTGFLSSFGVRMKKFNRLVPPHGQCLEDKNGNLETTYHGFSYSTEGCHRICTQKEVSRICGCANPTYPIPNTTTACKVSNRIARECIKKATLNATRLISEGNLPDCVCHQPCSEINYEVTYSAARWPSGTTKVMECEVMDDLCMERYRKNAAMIQVFYEELNYEMLTETPAYTLTSALADLGGLTGLWIGASVVSLMEIIALIVYTAQAYVRKRKRHATGKISQSSVYPKYSVRSLSSISTVSSIRMRKTGINTPPNMLQNSTPSIISQKKEQDEKLSPERTKYLPPSADLPCECIYEKGKMKIMSELCPEHGFLVRRNRNCTLPYQVFGHGVIGHEGKNDEMNDIREEEMMEGMQDNENSENG